MIAAEGISHAFPTTGAPLAVLSDVSFTAQSGSFLAVVGPSGCGKTTLLRLVGDLLSPTSGRITCDGLSAAEARRQSYFGWVFQNPALLPWADVLANVKLPQRVRRCPGRPAEELVAHVGLGGFEHYPIRKLSGGMKQRVALARALALSPKVLLLDEPFASLDELTRETLDDLLQDLHVETAATCMMVTHSISEAIFLADAVMVMTERPARIRAWIEVPFVRPRRAELRETAEFQTLTRALRKALR